MLLKIFSFIIFFTSMLFPQHYLDTGYVQVYYSEPMETTTVMNINNYSVALIDSTIYPIQYIPVYEISSITSFDSVHKKLRVWDVEHQKYKYIFLQEKEYRPVIKEVELTIGRTKINSRYVVGMDHSITDLAGNHLYLNTRVISPAEQIIVNGKASVTSNPNQITRKPGKTVTVLFQINTEQGGKQLGGSTIVIQFDTLSLSMIDNPVAGRDYTFKNFNYKSNINYDTATVTHPVKNQIWINIILTNDNMGNLVAKVPKYSDIVTVTFQRKDATKPVNIKWLPLDKYWRIYDGDNVNVWIPGKFQNIINYR